MLELISVHVPKCAGWSFYKALARAYSPESILYDHADRPGDPSSPMNLDPEGFLRRAQAAAGDAVNGRSVVHGHFYVRKYDLLKDRCLRITFLRNPVERAISHYYYWLGSERHEHALHDYVLDQQLSLLEFARLPFIRFLYTKVFFREVDPKTFDFIGSHETINEDVKRVGKLLGRDLAMERTNGNPISEYSWKQQEILADRRVCDELRDTLAEDIRFYEKAIGKA